MLFVIIGQLLYLIKLTIEVAIFNSTVPWVLVLYGIDVFLYKLACHADKIARKILISLMYQSKFSNEERMEIIWIWSW